MGAPGLPDYFLALNEYACISQSQSAGKDWDTVRVRGAGARGHRSDAARSVAESSRSDTIYDTEMMSFGADGQFAYGASVFFVPDDAMGNPVPEPPEMLLVACDLLVRNKKMDAE